MRRQLPVEAHRRLDGESAAAIFGDADKVKYSPLTAKERFTALQSGEIDVLTRNCTQTLSRDTSLGLDFAQVNYYDGQGFLVPKALGVKSAKELGGAAVCVLPGTTTELNAADFFRSNGMEWKPVVIENTAEAQNTYATGLRLTVALAVGIALLVGVFRILKGWPVQYLIIGGYFGVVIMTFFAPPEIVGIAYDSGGVTTSTVTVPLVAALGIGLAGSIRGRDPLIDGFGLIAFASLTPMIFVMAYGMFF